MNDERVTEEMILSCMGDNPQPTDEFVENIPEHKMLINITADTNENLFDNNFLVEVIAPKFCLKESFNETKLDQKNGMVVVMEHAPNVLKNLFKASKKENLKCKLQMAVDDEIYSEWELINPKIVAINMGVLTKNEINRKRDSFIECEIDFDEISIDGEKLY